jgi:hypothetical protein
MGGGRRDERTKDESGDKYKCGRDEWGGEGPDWRWMRMRWCMDENEEKRCKQNKKERRKERGERMERRRNFDSKMGVVGDSMEIDVE